VGELAPGDEVDQIFLVREATIATARNGKGYVRAELCDRTGSIGAVQFDADAGVIAQYPASGYVRVRGKVESYRNKVNLKVQQAREADPAEVESADFRVTTEADVEELRAELDRLVKSVGNADLKRLLDAIFGEQGFLDRFAAAPGATTYHHACSGGLMEHTMGVARSAEALAEVNPRLDRDMLVAGALLHDIGKMDELSPDAGFQKTDAGNLLGHVVLGLLDVSSAIARLDGFPEALALEVLHLMASHHGEREYGSPVLPATPEALALHHLDNLDAKVEAAGAATRAPASPGTNWTDFNKMLGVRVYRKPGGEAPSS
jgi:3'-5' exoribonuclease